MKEKNFEPVLPEGYAPVLVVDAQEKKLAIRLNIAATVITIVLLIPAVFYLLRSSDVIGRIDTPEMLIACAAMFAYIILHELTHGAAYKILTGHKLTFGFTLSVAYCGVPDIFVYRKTAMISLLAPFTVFSFVFLAGAAFVPDPAVKFLMLFLFAIHFGGCAGDLYDTFLFLTKLKDPTILMQDTGPKQTFYAKQ